MGGRDFRDEALAVAWRTRDRGEQRQKGEGGNSSREHTGSFPVEDVQGEL